MRATATRTGGFKWPGQAIAAVPGATPDLLGEALSRHQRFVETGTMGVP